MTAIKTDRLKNVDFDHFFLPSVFLTCYRPHLSYVIWNSIHTNSSLGETIFITLQTNWRNVFFLQVICRSAFANKTEILLLRRFEKTLLRFGCNSSIEFDMDSFVGEIPSRGKCVEQIKISEEEDITSWVRFCCCQYEDSYKDWAWVEYSYGRSIPEAIWGAMSQYAIVWTTSIANKQFSLPPSTIRMCNSSLLVWKAKLHFMKLCDCACIQRTNYFKKNKWWKYDKIIINIDARCRFDLVNTCCWHLMNSHIEWRFYYHVNLLRQK